MACLYEFEGMGSCVSVYMVMYRYFQIAFHFNENTELSKLRHNYSF